MSPKERRERLLKNRPFIRPFQIYDEWNYHKDVAILWAAHQMKPFYAIDPSLSQERFASEIEGISKTTDLLIVEDDNSSFEEGRGPVCLIGVSSDNWRAEPCAEFFAWSTKKNVLRVTVTFLQWVQYKKIGVCIVKSLEETKNLFDHCRLYGVLFYVGKIVGGDPRGDEYLYSIMGKTNPKRKEKTHGIP